jgi:cyd operon protein YbgT
MWYFAWLLALAFGVINVMWYEAEQYRETEEDTADISSNTK